MELLVLLVPCVLLGRCMWGRPSLKTSAVQQLADVNYILVNPQDMLAHIAQQMDKIVIYMVTIYIHVTNGAPLTRARVPLQAVNLGFLNVASFSHLFL